MKLLPCLTRLLPLGLLGCCLPAATGAAPSPSVNPFNEELALVFADEFDGTRLDPAVWESESYDKGLSRDTARGPDNLEVRDGELRLYVRKEERQAGQRRSKWTAGYVHTHSTVENNVLIDVRFKPGYQHSPTLVIAPISRVRSSPSRQTAVRLRF